MERVYSHHVAQRRGPCECELCEYVERWLWTPHPHPPTGGMARRFG